MDKLCDDVSGVVVSFITIRDTSRMMCVNRGWGTTAREHWLHNGHQFPTTSHVHCALQAFSDRVGSTNAPEEEATAGLPPRVVELGWELEEICETTYDGFGGCGFVYNRIQEPTICTLLDHLREQRAADPDAPFTPLEQRALSQLMNAGKWDTGAQPDITSTSSWDPADFPVKPWNNIDAYLEEFDTDFFRGFSTNPPWTEINGKTSKEWIKAMVGPAASPKFHGMFFGVAEAGGGNFAHYWLWPNPDAQGESNWWLIEISGCTD